MKHDKKHRKNKSPKRSKKSKTNKREKKKLKHKDKKRRQKKLEKTIKLEKEEQAKTTASQNIDDEDVYCGPSIDLMNKAKCPETKEEYESRQKILKRVVDPETGRVRLIKGDGEVLEEIVTRGRHKQINREATQNDGYSFQKNTVGAFRK